jgi:hypothetical protein
VEMTSTGKLFTIDVTNKVDISNIMKYIFLNFVTNATRVILIIALIGHFEISSFNSDHEKEYFIEFKIY